MTTELEIRPITNPFVMRQFARGNVLSDAEQIATLQGLLYNAVAEFSRQENDWKQLPAYIDKILMKDRLRTRFYPAGIIPFFQHPLAVLFKITGEYCLLFELVGLKNGRCQLDLPIESNISPAFFMDLLAGVIKKNQDIGNCGLSYELIAQLSKIDGLRNYGVTLRHPPELMGDDLLVVSENPFGTEFRQPVKVSGNRDTRYDVRCVVDRETKKKMKTIPDMFFIWEMFQSIAAAWPEDKSAADLVRLLEKALAGLNLRAVGKRRWYLDKTITKDRMPISWMVENGENNVIREARENSGIVTLPLVGIKEDELRLIVSFKGLTEDAAKSIETIYENEPLPSSLKTLFSLRKKNDDSKKETDAGAVTFQKAPRELSRAILKALQRNLSVSFAGFRYSIQDEMRRMKLEQTMALDMIRFDIEQKGPVVYVPEISSDLIYKFIIERRTDENTESFGVIQVDDEDDEIRRFSIAKSRIPLS